MTHSPLTTTTTATTFTFSPDKRLSPRRRLGALSTARLFHIFVLLNGCGFTVFCVLWSNDATTTQVPPARALHWQEGSGRRGTLEIPIPTTTTHTPPTEPVQNQTKPNKEQISALLQFLNQSTSAQIAAAASTSHAAASPISSSTAAAAAAAAASTTSTTNETDAVTTAAAARIITTLTQIAASEATPETTTNTDAATPEPEPKLSPEKGGRWETIRRLEALGVNISEYTEFLPFLPEWSQVVAQYGDGPRIHGLETCQAYQNAIPFFERTMAPTGLFNSGTNLLAFLMEDNCQISEGMQRYGGCRLPQRGISWQPPWGKHNPIAARFSDYSINKTIYTSIPHQVVLPVVTVRHPLDWMNSTCRHRYALRFVRWDLEDGKECPFIVAKPPDDRTVPVYVDYAFPGRIYYKSLAHLWNRWNRPYFDGVNRFGNRTFASVTTDRTLSTQGNVAPRLMVRHEDLIFYPDQVVQKVCQCIGGKYLFHGQGFQLTVESAKLGPGHGKTKTGFLDAWIKYGHERKYGSFDPLDKAKAIEFFDKQMLRRFHYQV